MKKCGFLSVLIGCVSFARYCGKIYNRHFFFSHTDGLMQGLCGNLTEIFLLMQQTVLKNYIKRNKFAKLTKTRS